jgi:hypothetical protein
VTLGAAARSDHGLSADDLPEKITGGTAGLEARFYNPLVRVDDDIAMVCAHYISWSTKTCITVTHPPVTPA